MTSLIIINLVCFFTLKVCARCRRRRLFIANANHVESGSRGSGRGVARGGTMVLLTAGDHLVAPGHGLQLLHGVRLCHSVAIHLTYIRGLIHFVLAAIHIRQGFALIALDGSCC